MLEHIRRFVHESGSLYLIVKRVHEVHPKDISPEKSEDRERRKPEHEITTWSWCRKCAVVSYFVHISEFLLISKDFSVLIVNRKV